MTTRNYCFFGLLGLVLTSCMNSNATLENGLNVNESIPLVAQTRLSNHADNKNIDGSDNLTPIATPTISNEAISEEFTQESPLPSVNYPVFKNEDELLLAMSPPYSSCKLPCVLGIHPGLTTTENVKTLFSEMKLFQNIDINEWNGEPLAYGNPALLSFSVSVFIQKNQVEGLALNYYRNMHNTDDTLPMESFITQYLIEDVLYNHGSPNTVYLLVHEPEIGGYFSLFLFYDDLGFAIRYTYDGDVIKEEGILSICKNDKYLVDIDIYSKTSGMDWTFEENFRIQNFMRDRLAEFDEISLRPFEEIYEEIIAGSEFGCFDTNQ